MQAPSRSRLLLASCAVPAIWALHFAVIYGFTGLVCARPRWDWVWLGVAATTWGVAGAGVLALVAIAAFSKPAWQQRRAPGDQGFLAAFTIGLALMSALGVLYETVTVWLVPSCV